MMGTITISIDGLSTPKGNVVNRILKRFGKEAGELLVREARALLGTDAIYQLNPGYAAKKPRLKKYRHQSGKPPHQPLILSGAMWEAIEAQVLPDAVFTIELSFKDGQALANGGTDYATDWEEETALFDNAVEAASEKLETLLLEIVMQEMGA